MAGAESFSSILAMDTSAVRHSLYKVLQQVALFDSSQNYQNLKEHYYTTSEEKQKLHWRSTTVHLRDIVIEMILSIFCELFIAYSLPFILQIKSNII